MLLKSVQNTANNYIKLNYIRKMATLSSIVSKLNDFAPLSLAENSWDNVGLLVEPSKPRFVNYDLKIINFTVTNSLTSDRLKQSS